MFKKNLMMVLLGLGIVICLSAYVFYLIIQTLKLQNNESIRSTSEKVNAEITLEESGKPAEEKKQAEGEAS